MNLPESTRNALLVKQQAEQLRALRRKVSFLKEHAGAEAKKLYDLFDDEYDNSWSKAEFQGWMRIFDEQEAVASLAKAMTAPTADYYVALGPRLEVVASSFSAGRAKELAILKGVAFPFVVPASSLKDPPKRG